MLQTSVVKSFQIHIAHCENMDPGKHLNTPNAHVRYIIFSLEIVVFIQTNSENKLFIHPSKALQGPNFQILACITITVTTPPTPPLMVPFYSSVQNRNITKPNKFVKYFTWVAKEWNSIIDILLIFTPVSRQVITGTE